MNQAGKERVVGALEGLQQKKSTMLLNVPHRNDSTMKYWALPLNYTVPLLGVSQSLLDFHQE